VFTTAHDQINDHHRPNHYAMYESLKEIAGHINTSGMLSKVFE